MLIFDFLVTDAYLVYLTQPSFFHSLLLPFCYCCSNFHMHPFKYLFSIKAKFCTHMHSYDCLFFRLFCNQCSSHASILNKKPLSLIVYSGLFVVILQSSMCTLSIKATVLTCTPMTAYFWFSCNWCSYLNYTCINLTTFIFHNFHSWPVVFAFLLPN